MPPCAIAEANLLIFTFTFIQTITRIIRLLKPQGIKRCTPRIILNLKKLHAMLSGQSCLT